ncbi:heme exporter protein CcmD [Seongchinamella sediminis]|uniref:Heme exporter protein D n=1 Tax=Seongchinamella sediminis TaxID=2283635 RepID=A0A3L7E0I4_9GAMM|nr:heme exporter protein CcmD [Seongchinamella sediminis]RLQ23016.1 heme exporter protein CcmD [Seongchinamella sediminis]
MYFDSLQALLYMDGHGPYVWAAYLITVLVILLVLLAPLRRRTRFINQARGELRRTAGALNVEGESNASSS